MRKVLPVVAAAVAGLVLARRAQARRSEAELWAEVTDAPRVSPSLSDRSDTTPTVSASS